MWCTQYVQLHCLAVSILYTTYRLYCMVLRIVLPLLVVLLGYSSSIYCIVVDTLRVVHRFFDDAAVHSSAITAAVVILAAATALLLQQSERVE